MEWVIEIKYSCNKCHKEVKTKERFISYCGEVLCSECSKGVEPCSVTNRLFWDMEDDLSEIYFYLQKADLNIKSQLVSVEHNREEIYIEFTAGTLSIWRDSIIKEVKRPSNSEDKFEFCYLIKNNSGEVLGYIGKQSI